jgi:hypothetical protein
MVGSQAALAILLPATVIPLLLLSREARQKMRAGLSPEARRA